MGQTWGRLGALIERVTLERAAIVLPLLTLLAGGLLTLSEWLADAEALPPLDPAMPVAALGPQEIPVTVSELQPEVSPTAPSDGQLPPPAAEPTAPSAAQVPPVTEPTLAPIALPAPTSAPQATEAGDLNIVLLGSDRRPGHDTSWRTDAIIVVAIRQQAGMIGLFSIPRDLWVAIPGHAPNRINVVDCLGERIYGRGGGPRLLAETLRQNLDIPVHAYVRTDFAGLERIIDALGGITVDSSRAFDEWMDEDTPNRWHFQVSPGLQHMDGRTALGYARSRRQTGDLDRCRRQQQILLAVRDAALSPAVLPRVPALVRTLADVADTDLSLDQALALLPLASQLEPGAYRTKAFDASMVRDWVTPDGAMVLLPNRERIERAWRDLFN